MLGIIVESIAEVGIVVNTQLLLMTDDKDKMLTLDLRKHINQELVGEVACTVDLIGAGTIAYHQGSKHRYPSKTLSWLTADHWSLAGRCANDNHPHHGCKAVGIGGHLKRGLLKEFSVGQVDGVG